MSRKEDAREDNPREANFGEDLHELSELEATLAALVPRMEGLNRDRLMFLAGQASVESKLSQPAVGQIANLPTLRQVGNLPHATQVGKVPHATGWAWPAAFAAMTGIAALLLAALVIRSAPPATEQPGPQMVERNVTAPQGAAIAVAQDGAGAGSAAQSPWMVAALPDWLAYELFPPPGVGTKRELSYTEVRNQVLLHGLEPVRPRPGDSAATGRVHEEPILDRGQLNRWLEKEGVESVLRRLSTPSLRNPSGARS